MSIPQDNHHGTTAITRKLVSDDGVAQLEFLVDMVSFEKTSHRSERTVGRFQLKLLGDDSEIVFEIKRVVTIIAKVIPRDVGNDSRGNGINIGTCDFARLITLGRDAESLRRTVVGHVCRPAHFGDPYGAHCGVCRFGRLGRLLQIGNEAAVDELLAVRMDRENVERRAQFDRAPDEGQIDAGRGTTQHLCLRVGFRMAAYALVSNSAYMSRGPCQKKMLGSLYTSQYWISLRKCSAAAWAKRQ